MPELESWAIKVFGEFASILREDVRRRVQAFDSGPRKEASAQDRRGARSPSLSASTIAERTGHASGDGPKRDLNRLAASVGFTVAYETVKRCLLTHHGDTRQAASITIVPGRKARDMDRELAKAAYITANGWWGTRRRRFEDGSLSEARKRPRNALDT